MPAQETVTSTLKPENQEKDLLTWTAPSRPFKRRNRDFYVTILAIAGLFGIVLFLIEGFMPVLLIISLVFLFYVMSTVEPEAVTYKVTTLGIKVGDKRTDWEIMTRFWFTKRFDSDLLVAQLVTFPGRLEVVIRPEQRQEIKSAISKYLLYEQLPASFLDKAANWFSQKLPGGRV